MESLTRTELERKLEMMGIIATCASDPVDGGEIVVLDMTQTRRLIEHYEAALRHAVETRPIVIEVKTDAGQREVVRLAVEQERQRIIEIMSGPHPAGSAYDSFTLAEMIGRING